MIENLGWLIPNWKALFLGGDDALSAGFVTIMLLLALFFVAVIITSYLKFNKHLQALKSIYMPLLAEESDNEETAYFERRSMLNRAQSLTAKQVTYLWRDFNESLVSSKQQKRLYSTIESAYFFNEKSLGEGLSGSRMLLLGPSLLVALGVLGTFTGLSIGLSGVNLQGSDIEELKSGVVQLISGASLAFLTSVWGVGLSLSMNLCERFFESRVLVSLKKVQDDLDGIFPNYSSEQTLLEIGDSSFESQVALQELHEKIGSKLQEALHSMGDSMQHAITTALNNIMAPAIETLISSTSQQSSRALEGLVEQFMHGMSEAGGAQAEQLKTAAESVNHAAERMGDGLNMVLTQFTEEQRQLSEAGQAQFEKMQAQHQTFVDRLSESAEATLEQNRTIVAQHRELLDSMQGMAGAIKESSQHLDNSSNQLGLLSTNLQKTATQFDEGLILLSEALTETGEQNATVAAQIQSHMETLSQVIVQLNESAETMQSSAEVAKLGYASLEEHQSSFLEGLEEQLGRLTESLRSHVGSLEEQVSKWLEEYSLTVKAQVENRMDEWNTQTINFASEMKNTVEAIGGLVDELEHKTTRR